MVALITDIPAARPALFLFALFAAAEDFRTRTVPLWLFQGAGVLLLLWHLFRALRDGSGILLSLWAGPLAGLVPGLLLLLVSRLNGGDPGEGDALFFLVLGAALGLKLLLPVLAGTFTAASLGALVLFLKSLISGRSARNTELPLLPFSLPTLLLLLVCV